MKIVLVGGGSSALFFLENLIQARRSEGLAYDHEITVVASQPSPGDPRAFGLEVPPELILNTPNQELDTLIPGWRAYRVLHEDPDATHSARAVFGQFLLERWTHATEEAAKLFSFRLESGLVRRIGHSCAQYLVETDSASLFADVVILCVGTADPSDLRGPSTHCDLLDTYGPGIQSIGTHDSVAILGSRLTAVDALLRLRAQKHRGPIHVASSSGRLPRVRPELEGKGALLAGPCWLERPSFRRGLSLRECWDLAVKTLGVESTELKQLLDSRPTTPASWIEEVFHAESGLARDWQRRAYQASVLMEDLWVHLSPSAQAEFLLRFRSAFLSNLVSMPLQSARAVLELLQSGQLVLHAGLSSVESGKSNKESKEHSFRFQNGTVLTTKHGINATGQRPGVRFSGLQASLIGSGLARIETNGALSTDRFTCEVQSTKPKPGLLLCIGELSIGRGFVSSSLETNLRQAIRASRTVLAALLASEAGKVRTSL